jgi:hypothetical protein
MGWCSGGGGAWGGALVVVVASCHCRNASAVLPASRTAKPSTVVIVKRMGRGEGVMSRDEEQLTPFARPHSPRGVWLRPHPHPPHSSSRTRMRPSANRSTLGTTSSVCDHHRTLAQPPPSSSQPASHPASRHQTLTHRATTTATRHHFSFLSTTALTLPCSRRPCSPFPLCRCAALFVDVILAHVPNAFTHPRTHPRAQQPTQQAHSRAE